MATTNKDLRRYGGIAGNIVFVAVILLLVFNPAAKGWFLRQLMTVGLFNAEMKKGGENLPFSPASPAMTFRDKDGANISTADLAGKVLFINFWATWCPPCRAEMPALADLYKQFSEDNRVVFLFVTEDNDPAKAAEYLKNNDFSVPLFTAVGDLPPDVYSGTLPTTVVIDKKGAVVYRHEGLARYNTAAFMTQLKTLASQ